MAQAQIQANNTVRFDSTSFYSLKKVRINVICKIEFFFAPDDTKMQGTSVTAEKVKQLLKSQTEQLFMYHPTAKCLNIYNKQGQQTVAIDTYSRSGAKLKKIPFSYHQQNGLYCLKIWMA